MNTLLTIGTSAVTTVAVLALIGLTRSARDVLAEELAEELRKGQNR